MTVWGGEVKKTSPGSFLATLSFRKERVRIRREQDSLLPKASSLYALNPLLSEGEGGEERAG